MPTRRIKTPEELHDEELDKLALPPISFLVSVDCHSDDGSEMSFQSWSYVSKTSAVSAFLRLTDTALDQTLVSGFPKPRKAIVKLLLCDRELKPTKVLAKTEIQSPDHVEGK